MGKDGERTRVWPFVVAVGIALSGLVAVVAYVTNEQLEDSLDREIRSVAIQRAHLANEFGSALPVLTAEKMRAGFSRSELASLEAASARVQESQPLVALTIFDHRRRLVYPPGGRIRLNVPEGIEQALAGSSAVEQLGTSEDRVLEASVPIHDVNGEVIGASVVTLDASELRKVVGFNQRRITATIAGAAALLWLLLLPLSVRLARLAAPHVSLERWRTVAAVRRALGTDGLEVHYQPKVTLPAGEPFGAEGLVRWRRNGELIPPGQFLPHVESSDLVWDLTEFVLDRAVADATAWRHEGHDLSVAVNLSPQSFAREGLPELVDATLSKHGLDPSALTLEVTETAVFEDPMQIEMILNRLAAIGVTISVDDFGTGHSSLARLQRFPISEVKIDRSFVDRITADERPFVEAIARLANSLDLEVVAEGVEDIATLELLARSGCRAAQGFFFCRPLPLSDFKQWLREPHAMDTATLNKLGIELDTATIDELVEAARRLSDSEVAWLAHFVDDAHVFDAIRGDAAFFNVREGDSVPLSESYCARMVSGEMPNVIGDARTHPVTRGLAVTAEADIGSYVGVPVRLPAGDLYGSLCSASHIARTRPPETVRLLSVLAAIVGERLGDAISGNDR